MAYLSATVLAKSQFSDPKVLVQFNRAEAILTIST